MPDAMKVLRFHGPRDIRLETVPRPGKPGPGQVLVRVEAAGICGSDLHVFETGAYVTQIPVIAGHEFSGRAIQVGAGVTEIDPGDHVVGDSRQGCGQCPACRRGHSNLCLSLGFLGEVRDGAFAEEILVEATLLHRIAPEVPFDIAALAEPLAVAIHAVKQAEIEGSPRTLVLGAGPIGALVHQVLIIQGTSDTTVAEVSAYRKQILEAAHPGAVREPEGTYDLVFETTGARPVLEEVVPKAMRKRGRLVMVGLFGGKIPFDFNLIVENEWTVKGCAAFSTELPEAVRMLETHGARFRRVISHRLPLEAHQAAYERLLDARKEGVKIIFRPQGPDAI